LGGPGGSGTVFSLKTDGSGFKVLREFLPLSDVLVISGGYGVYTRVSGWVSGTYSHIRFGQCDASAQGALQIKAADFT
jgi:hypothetical protein